MSYHSDNTLLDRGPIEHRMVEGQINIFNYVEEERLSTSRMERLLRNLHAGLENTNEDSLKIDYRQGMISGIFALEDLKKLATRLQSKDDSPMGSSGGFVEKFCRIPLSDNNCFKIMVRGASV